MRLAGLFSGDKDSTFSLLKALEKGYQIPCLISIHPFNDESLLYHFPNSNLFKKISTAFEIPIIERYCNNTSKEHEINQLISSVKQAIDEYSIEGLTHGTISSKFQLDIFQTICTDLNLKLYSPIWNIDPYEYYKELFASHFEIIITRVASLGLDEKWLGKTINKNIKYKK